MRVAVVGGGAFGVMTAIRLAELDQDVTLFERKPSLMQGASRSGNRLHLGFHYPRDEETIRQCIRGYEKFRSDFESCILTGVKNAYFIACEGSLTSPHDFLKFCDDFGLPYRPIDPGAFIPAVHNVDLGVLTEEVMYDPDGLRRLMVARLDRSGARSRLCSDVSNITREDDGSFAISTGDGGKSRFDAVVNCTYSDVNRLTAQLGHEIGAYQYEYTAAPIIELDLPELCSITVLDGDFMSLLPYGGAGQYLLFHVQHSVIARDDTLFMNPRWLDFDTAPFASLDEEAWFERLLDSCTRFVPALRQARLKEIRQAPRMVLANAEDTDARPSIVTLREPGYVTVFCGKIDHCTWVADEVAQAIDSPGSVW
jgi:glycine/D-amino acid oxidase-like deaminating enzyme